MTFRMAMTLWVAMAAGHVVAQALRRVPNWESALDRSVFQGVAILVCYWTLRWSLPH